MRKKLAFGLGAGWVAVAVYVLAACDGATLVVASTSDSSTSTLPVVESGAGVERWVGFVEQHKFPSGSDRVEIVVRGDGTGTLRAGEPGATEPARSTDKEIGWPSDLCNGNEFTPTQPLVENLDYPLGEVTREASRLRMKFFRSAPWKDWCELQTPFPIMTSATGDAGPGTIGAYRCVENTGFSFSPGNCALASNDGSTVPIDCVKAALCGMHPMCSPRACECTATGCTASSFFEEINLFVSGNTADGTSPVGRLRLTRQ